MNEESSEFLQHEPCPSCGSSDALARYSDLHGFCFRCSHWQPGEGQEPTRSSNRRSKVPKDLITDAEVKALKKRKISEETCRKFGYMVGKDRKGNTVQIAPYHDTDGRLIGQKLRYPDKSMPWLGDPKKATLFGQQLWKAGGKMVVCTEGELDCLSVSQLQGNKWPVVSLAHGAGSAKKSLQAQIEWLESFEKVVLMFDMDEPGKEAVHECAPLFSPGKLFVASLPLKDANEMLVVGRGSEVITAIWQAKEYRPDGIIDAFDIDLDELMVPTSPGLPTGCPLLDTKLGGLRSGELTLLTAGTGLGKSTLARQWGHRLVREHGQTVGNLFLEESYKKTALGYIAIDNAVPLGVLRADPSAISREAYERSKAQLFASGKVFFFNHFGSTQSDNLLAKLRYLIVGLGARWVILDHISIVVSGMEGSGNERKDIDILMTRLRSLVEETGAGVIAIVHLKRVEGKTFNEGSQVSLSDLRGSAALEQLSDNIIALERDQQGKDPDRSVLRVLKNREFGDVGQADTMQYDRKTGLMHPVEQDPYEDEEDEGVKFEDAEGDHDDIPF